MYPNLKRNVTFLCLSILILAVLPACWNMKKDNQPTLSADVVIYGGTSAAVIAAVQVAQMGKTALIVCPDTHLGGLSASGLGYTDTGNKVVIGGLSREFYRRLYMHYQTDEAW